MIGTVHSNPEFKAVLYKVETTQAAKVTYWRTAEHVPEAESNNLVIHERTRETFHRLPCQFLHEAALIVLVIVSTKCLNYFPPKGGVSDY